MSTIDLNTPPPNHVYSVSVEREETIAERRVRLFREVILFLVAIAFFVTAAGISFWTLRIYGRKDNGRCRSSRLQPVASSAT